PVEWAPDGSVFYGISPAGALAAFPVTGGAAREIAPDGVSIAEVGPDGVVASARAGTATYGSQSLPAEGALDLGFRGTALEVATAQQVTVVGGPAIALAETATAASFAPGGTTVAYIGASGLHVLDLAAGSDHIVGPAGALGGWQGTRLVFLQSPGVFTLDASGAKAHLLDLKAVDGATWTASGQLLLSTPDTLYLASGDGGRVVALAHGLYSQPVAAPAGTGFAFSRAGQEFTASVTGLGPAPAAPTQADVLTAFMNARVAGQADVAGTYLDAAGKKAFAQLPLTYPVGAGQPQLARYYLLLSQPGRALVRLVLTQGGSQSTIDESLVLLPGADGKLLIHAVTETAARPLAAGPNVIGVTVASHEIRVMFDSDLDPTSVRGVTVDGDQAAVTYDAKSRAVVLSSPAGLAPGRSYELNVSATLTDVNGDTAAPLTVALTGPGQ
ncbi:MAG: Ig-like domain-containing protein, partial [Candidatus Dormibacteraeota bacterium]|nr:Ig-like domain-containing protein [Candidatus Dormibacteraeota bacterium]